MPSACPQNQRPLIRQNERKLSGEDAESILMNAILGDEFDEENEDDDLFGDEGFESLDDFEEFQ
jgi:hypothetical protein